MYKFKVGDIVELRIPNGCKLQPGTTSETNFKGGLTDKMVAILKQHKRFQVKSMYSDQMLLYHGGYYYYDVAWFKKASESSKQEFINVDISINGDETTVQILNGTGQAIKGSEDTYDVKIGILIAMARALGFDKSKVNQIVDVVYDDNKTINNCSNEELLKELLKRDNERLINSLL